MRTVLAVDVGRTGCRAAFWRGDASQPEAVADGDGSLGLGAANGPDVAEAAILAVVQPLLKAHGVDCIDAAGVGTPGAMQAPAASVCQTMEVVPATRVRKRPSLSSSDRWVCFNSVISNHAPT